MPISMNLPAARLSKSKTSLPDQETLRSKVKSILNDIEQQGRPSVNTVDPDCAKTHSRQGDHAGFNGQIVVDEKHGLIVSSDVVNENTDNHQFADQTDQASEVLGKKCDTACGDAGYAKVEELEKTDKQGIEVIVPSQRQASAPPPKKPFDARNFTYDRASDRYICPKGKILSLRNIERKKRRKIHLGLGATCLACEHFGTCTTNRIHGRKVTRLLKEDIRQKIERQYELPQSQEIYKLRKQNVEHPFGHIKHNLGVAGFLLRGIAGVKAEFSIMTSCFNIARMITLLGTEKLVESIAAMMIPAGIVDFNPIIQAENITITEKTVHIRQIIEFRKKTPQTQTAYAA